MSKVVWLASAAVAATLTVGGAAQAQTGMDWAGFYAGFHAGYLDGNVNLSDEGSPGGGHIAGGIGGVLGGYRFRMSSVARGLLGVEADFGWANVSGSGVIVDDVNQFHYDLEWDAHARLIASLPVGNVLLFAAGGLVFAKLNITEDYLPLWNNIYTGGTVGAGVDVAMGHVVGRAEFLYDFFPTQSRGEYSASMHNFTGRVAIIFKLP